MDNMVATLNIHMIAQALSTHVSITSLMTTTIYLETDELSTAATTIYLETDELSKVVKTIYPKPDELSIQMKGCEVR